MRNLYHNKNYLKIGIWLVLMLVLSACATTETKTEIDVTSLDLNKYATVTASRAVEKIENSINAPENAVLQIYAPKHYLTVNKAIKEAQNLLKKNQSRDKIIQKVAVAEAIMNNGDKVMRRVKDILSNEISIKEKLDSLNTENVYRSEYGSLNERFNTIIREIESGKLNENEANREKLLNDMQALERKSIHYSAMHEPQELLKRVKNRGAEQLAPLTYQEAVAVYQKAEQFIRANPNYDIGIEQMGREALFAAKRVLYISENVSGLSQKMALSPEQIVLDEEYRLHRIARELFNADFRNNPLEVQSEKLAAVASELSQELKNKDDLVIALRDTLIKVRDSSSRLTLLSDITKSLKKEKGEWLAKEALFKAKVLQLETNLNKSQFDLNQTQQKLLASISENNTLSQLSAAEKQKNSTLTEQIRISNAGKAKQKTMKPYSATTPLAASTQKNSASENPVSTDEDTVADTEEQNENFNEDATEDLLDDDIELADTDDSDNELDFDDSEFDESNTETSPVAKETIDITSQPRTTKNINSDTTESTAQKTNQPPVIATKTEVSVAQQPVPAEIIDEADTNPTSEPKVSATIENDDRQLPTSAAINQESISSNQDIVENEATRKKITMQETLDALESAKELLKTLKSEELKINADNAITIASEDSLDDNEDSFSIDDDEDDAELSLEIEAFVEASE